MTPIILVAGATGELGGRINKALLARGAAVRALVRTSSDPAKVDELTAQGVEVVRADLTDVAQVTAACTGTACVVSALQGLHDVVVDAQSVLLEAAVAAGVPRFIPSDFSTDFTKLPAGENRNFDLRREFKERLDHAPIAATSILNGAFGEVLTYNIPLLDFKKKSVGYWEDADWRIDFTTMDDTAAYTAAAALDPTTPRLLRIASFQLSPRELAVVGEQVTKEPFALVRMGSRAELAAHTQHARAAHPEGEQELYPAWQQMQYMLSMFSVQHNPLDNNRYPEVQWTSAPHLLAEAMQARATPTS
ncbi:NmrA family NAD(P)-binding protein [Hymenobacter tibetensis]|uniref:NmrA family NAD(P)-binding protein n=1 Tax=Hymenobacter tibetensis TaxID=497967 RepID=A0ABY4CVU1_9BACT|nr:NmrA family NAD(P)-binding protein [Hymenobacter tibetensis]UOG73290.1 NmrA family NAD(P)-binding protein [Hymenobacter tibetensis]